MKPRTKRKRVHRKNCACFDCDIKYAPGQEELVEKIQKRLEEDKPSKWRALKRGESK